MLRVPFSRTVKNFFAEKKFVKSLAGRDWYFSPYHVSLIMNEGKDWQKFYLPKGVDFCGAVVLDVGAGCGESAKVFLDAGASKVVCVEPYVKSFVYLKANSMNHAIVPVNSVFRLEMLDWEDFDFYKFDIEGYEECLLDVCLGAPAVAEFHGLQLRDKFVARGWRSVYHAGGNGLGLNAGCCTYGYWMC